jgi:hypothetical protein
MSETLLHRKRPYGDGRGDACDKCPLDVGPYCTAVNPYTGENVFITDGD